jgi:hypothetical protein
MGSEYKKNWSYFVETPAANLAVPLDEVKLWLKVSGLTLDDEITSLIKSATRTAEQITRREMINKGFRTFRDQFSDYAHSYGTYSALIPYGRTRSYRPGIELRKSSLQSLDSIEYLKSGVWTLVDSDIYYVTAENEYSRILLVEGESWPTDLDNREQAVRIDFTAGYGADSDSVPEDLKTAIKMHVANAFANRGDCVEGRFLPPAARAMYLNNRILEIGI